MLGEPISVQSEFLDIIGECFTKAVMVIVATSNNNPYKVTLGAAVKTFSRPKNPYVYSQISPIVAESSIAADKEVTVVGTYGTNYFVVMFGSQYWFVEQSALIGKGTKLENNDNGAYLLQGFSVGTNFCYSFEVNSKNTNDKITPDSIHNLYRFNMNAGGKREEMKIKNNQTIRLGHANDAALVSIEGKTYIYVAVYSDNEASPVANKFALVKLQYDGSGNYEEVARYPYKNNERIGGIAYMGNVKINGSNVDNAVEFLLKNGPYYYTVQVPFANTASNGQAITIEPKYKFKISFSKGSEDYGSYTGQSIHYDRDKDKLYVPMFGYNPKANPNPNKPNENVILVYENIKSEIKNENKNVQFDNSRIIKKGDKNNIVFEIEGCGFPVGRSPTNENDVLWFNANEGTSISAKDRTNGGIYTSFQNIK